MEKTSKDIEKDVFRALRETPLATAIRGSLYRDGQRPKNAKTEDLVVKFLTGIDGEEQSGIVLIHVYVPDALSVNKDGTKVEDLKRVSQLLALANESLADLHDEEMDYIFEKDGTPNSFPCEGIEQHFINIRLHYRRKTF